jgi:RNA polymerase sigma factor (sigma-70 family)
VLAPRWERGLGGGSARPADVGFAPRYARIGCAASRTPTALVRSAAMSPLILRRYRADRLLRREFERLRDSVLAAVGARLRAARIELDRGDLDAAYAQAWQGLHAALLEGREIDSPASWLVVVTFRRTVDEHRAHRHTTPEPDPAGAVARSSFGHGLPAGRDLAEELETRIRLEQLLEGLSRLSERERRVASLCYLQGLSRAEAAAEMGISEGRMRKLMEGRGAGEPGVAGKIGALAITIEQGGWCASQGSLMRALAYGILDPDGERYRLALTHRRRCSSCRAYVVSLRGLAAALPPVLLPGARFVLAGLAGRASRARAALAHVAGRGSGAGASSAPGAVGASSAGGGLALAGPFGAKLAVGCLMAIGVGAGCIGLGAAHNPGPVRSHPQSARSAAGGLRHALARDTAFLGTGMTTTATVPPQARTTTDGSRAALVREFGPEQALSVPGPVRAPAHAQGLLALRHRKQGPANRVGAPTARVASVESSPTVRAAAREFEP